MPRINIEEKWWGDFRREILAQIVSPDYDPVLADGLAINLWKLDLWFKKYKPGEQLTLQWIRLIVPGYDVLVKAHLLKILETKKELDDDSPVEILGAGELYNG